MLLFVVLVVLLVLVVRVVLVIFVSSNLRIQDPGGRHLRGDGHGYDDVAHGRQHLLVVN